MRDPTALQRLMTAFRDGDPCAFEGLEPQVFVLCYRKARSLGATHEEAEDVAQEVVVRGGVHPRCLDPWTSRRTAARRRASVSSRSPT